MAREERDMRASNEAALAPIVDNFEHLVEPLVEKLVPDPSQPPTPTVSLTGLLGRSAKEGYWRLYFSSGLKRYVEFKEEDVLHSGKIPKEQPPFAGLEATRVWLKREAEVEYTRTESRRRVQAKALQGGLAARFPIDPPTEAVLRSPIDPGPDRVVPLTTLWIDPIDFPLTTLWIPDDPIDYPAW